MAKKIRIIQTPPGIIAPEKIRKQWVGVELPVAAPKDSDEEHWVGTENTGGYLVNTKDAIKALRQAGKTEAADFWEEMKHQTGEQLRFGSEFCAVI